jgi:hypothetical protein
VPADTKSTCREAVDRAFRTEDTPDNAAVPRVILRVGSESLSSTSQVEAAAEVLRLPRACFLLDREACRVANRQAWKRKAGLRDGEERCAASGTDWGWTHSSCPISSCRHRHCQTVACQPVEPCRPRKSLCCHSWNLIAFLAAAEQSHPGLRADRLLISTSFLALSLRGERRPGHRSWAVEWGLAGSRLPLHSRPPCPGTRDRPPPDLAVCCWTPVVRARTSPRLPSSLDSPTARRRGWGPYCWFVAERVAGGFWRASRRRSAAAGCARLPFVLETQRRPSS